MMAKPMKTLELHYPMIQFLINIYILKTMLAVIRVVDDGVVERLCPGGIPIFNINFKDVF